MTIIALIGRPNVGKSTLFNRLVGRKVAIVDNFPGVTRDRNIFFTEYKGFKFTVMDTGGFEPNSKEFLFEKVREQSQLAIEEADAIVFVLDAQQGWTPQDQNIYEFLRKSQTKHHPKQIYFAINKIDHFKHELEIGEFYSSGIQHVYPISAEHGHGIFDLFEDISKDFPDMVSSENSLLQSEDDISIAVVGRPNAGKSSLVNCFLGEDKHIVDENAGTTRDSIDSFFQYHQKTIRLIDTAGMRRKSKVSQKVEKYSVISALKSIEKAHVALLVIDATQGAVEQDAKIANYALERGKPLILVGNKWDLVKKNSNTLEKKRNEIRDTLKFLDFSPILFVSAKTKKRVLHILEVVQSVYQESKKRIQTADVNRILESILVRHSPPMKGRRRTKIFYGSQVSILPPTFVISTNQPEAIPDSYTRFLEGQFRHYFGFEGTPIRIIWRKRDSGRNKGKIQ